MIYRRRTLAVLVALFFIAAASPVMAADSVWVKVGTSGRLVYTMDDRGDRIMDFSMVGYKGGTTPLPNYAKVITPDRFVTVNPVAGDNLANIQNAINSLAGMSLNSNGFRGVVQLAPGQYDVSGTISITTPGIILRGVGDGGDPTTNTIISYTGNSTINMINVDTSAGRSTVSNSTHGIVDKVVPAGAISFTVDSTSNWNVGDTIIVKRPSPQEWINDVNMDTLTNPWQPGSKNQEYQRVITHIDQTNKRVFLDAPLTNSLERQYGELHNGNQVAGTVFRYTWSRTNNVGIENIRGDGQKIVVDPESETHANSFIVMQDTQNGWVRNVTGQHQIYATVEVGTNSRNITVDDAVSIEPVSIITGGRRYPFNIEGHLSLMKNLASDHGRHDFVNNSSSRGPNVFLDGVATNSHSDTGPHQRWSTGTLYDNITTNHDINVQNRGNSGTGHGWAGANMVIWNSQASDFKVQNPSDTAAEPKPSNAQNWLIGSVGNLSSPSPYPSGYVDAHGSNVLLNGDESLYRVQLSERVAHPTEQRREYWVGDFDGYANDGVVDNSPPVDAAWLAAVNAAFPAQTTTGFDSATGTNAKIPFTFNFDVPSGRVTAATLSMSLKSGGGTPADDSIFIEDTANAIPLSSLALKSNFQGSATDILTLEFLPSDLTRSLDFLEDGKLNLLVNNDRVVDWAHLLFNFDPSKALVWTGTNGSAWNINTTENWVDGVDPEKFFNGDYVAFGDGPTNRNIAITGSVQPTTILVNSSVDYSFAGPGSIGGATSLTKDGTGTLTITANNTYTGPTNLLRGAITIGTGGTLGNGTSDLAMGSGANAAALNVTGNNATVFSLLVNTNTASDNAITLGASRIFTVSNSVLVGGVSANGANTDLIVTGGASSTVNFGAGIGGSLVVGNQSTVSNSATTLATLNLSSVTTFTANYGAFGQIGVGTTPSFGPANGPGGMLILANNNTLTAGVLRVGYGATNGGFSTLKLGQNNVLNANVISIGAGKGSGIMEFNTGLTNPSVIIRGTPSGVSRVNEWRIADYSDYASGGASTHATGTVNFTGGTVNARVTNLSIGLGRNDGNGAAVAVGTLTFDNGTIDATSIVLGKKGTSTLSATAAGATGTLNVNGTGQLIVGTGGITLGVANTGSGTGLGILNINGGSVTLGGPITDGGGTSSINFNGGTLKAALTTTTLMQGLDTASIQAGGATFDTNGFNVTIAQGLQNAGGGITKTGLGTLTLTGNNTYLGNTLVKNGTLSAGSNASLGTGGSTVLLGDTTGANSVSLLANAGGLAINRNITVQDDGSASTRLLGGSQTSGTATFSGALSLGKDLTVSALPGGTVALTGPLSNAAGKTLTKSGLGTVALAGQGTHGPGAKLKLTAGPLEVNASLNDPLGPNLAVEVNTGATLAVTAGTTSVKSLRGDPGTLDVADGAKLGMAPGSTVNNVLAALDLNTSGTLDLGDSALIIDYTGASPYSTHVAQLLSGYNGGLWNGPGIQSSVAAAGAGNTAIGIMDASELGLTSFTDPQGGTDLVDATSLILKYTYLGDADLDGDNDVDDFIFWSSAFPSASGATWFSGDFDYDGDNDVDDFVFWSSTFPTTAPLLGNLNSTPHAVPEPGSFALAGLALAAFVAMGLRPKSRKV